MSVTVRALQERAARALPAGYVEESGGWWLRHAPDCSWWVGTVLPHGGGATPGELDDRPVEDLLATSDALAVGALTSAPGVAGDRRGRGGGRGSCPRSLVWHGSIIGATSDTDHWSVCVTLARIRRLGAAHPDTTTYERQDR